MQSYYHKNKREIGHIPDKDIAKNVFRTASGKAAEIENAAYVLNRHLKTLAGMNFRLTRHAGVKPLRVKLYLSQIAAPTVGLEVYAIFGQNRLYIT